MNKTAYIGRFSKHFLKSALSFYIKSLPILGISVFPTSVCSCCKSMAPLADAETAGIYGKANCRISLLSDLHEVSMLDIFIFDDDILQRLDSYQHVELVDGASAEVASRTGYKKMFVCSNGQWTKEGWMNVNSYRSLDGIRAELSEERMQNPLMTGECDFLAHDRQTVRMELRPLSSEIVLRTLSCDFSGKGYKNEGISDMKVYLININSICRLLQEGMIMPEGIINMGRLDENDMAAMAEPEMICRECPSMKSGDRIKTDIRLRCYPNSSVEESPGSPFTRLVIEGKIKGRTYYWPIDIGRDGRAPEGIMRNCSYIYDVKITGKGSSDPDFAVRHEDAEISMEVRPWKECKDYVICF